MSILKKTVKYDIKLKDVTLGSRVGTIIDSDGVIVNLWELMNKAYDDKCFTISIGSSESDEIDLDDEPDDEE